MLPRAAGLTRVRAEAGAASLTFIVPAGVAARVHGTVALGSLNVDESRFPRFGNDYESTDYGSAANRVDLDINGGVGSIRVRSEG
jgi:predicted membrane protein